MFIAPFHSLFFIKIIPSCFVNSLSPYCSRNYLLDPKYSNVHMSSGSSEIGLSQSCFGSYSSNLILSSST